MAKEKKSGNDTLRIRMIGSVIGCPEKQRATVRGLGLREGFEGGQMPVHRRVPKRGFNNKWRKEYEAVNLEKLTIFDAGTIVTPELLLKRGMIKRLRDGLKILGDGELKQAITVRAHK